MFGLSSQLTNARLEALETVSANIMIADAKLNITYMNPAVRTLLKEAEADLKKELPRFDTATLIGSNIDIFHKNPTHQRGMLSALRNQHRATIWVGHHAFDLIVTPLKKGDKIEGFVVEWANAAQRLLNLDFCNQLKAISRAQAVIEFQTDGTIMTANENFTKTTGYSTAEIIGKNHRIFVAKGPEGDAEYDELWADLRNNQPRIGDIVRYHKNGQQIFLNASYNPITDEHGKVVKIVKFATDVSGRVQAVNTIGDALVELAGGNLTVHLDRAFTKEFEPLRNNMNEAVKKLGEAMADVSRSTDQIDSGSREISHSSNDLAKRTEQQAAALEETAAALDEITVNVKNASQRTDEARKATQAADSNAIRSGQIVAEAVDAMARIEGSSHQISNIIGVIDEIAFQTNLLALNAGVEAARAGEAGKGFAVVAQEVRELAQRSAQAAKEIKELIQNSSNEVKTGVKLVSETGEALKTIQENIVEVNNHMDAIASSAREQSTGLSEINSAVNQMDQTTQQNAAMVEEASAASATLARETERLRGLVARFDIPSSGQDRPVVATAAAAPRARPAVAGNTALKQEDWQEF
ncbi:methyl-accepting chemotaxis protein [Ciceribacter sp. L1K23]|uniref:methyl-accepting chemotaxis protein n=1 Tax=Ciceribacter sp. L1K23 TaxID=2820276 RepID=UPI001B8187F7|nr:methyl-accepting chemotaxis protein [Ciceribacter sp. L1K23]MBR0556964.1 methyl-accepting chemotaxis protein [Ciceribacter sp. L1K23]